MNSINPTDSSATYYAAPITSTPRAGTSVNQALDTLKIAVNTGDQASAISALASISNKISQAAPVEPAVDLSAGSDGFTSGKILDAQA